MNRALAIVLVFGTIAARGDDWQKTLTPPEPGSFAPLRPLHATYRFGWAKIPAATADFDYMSTKDGLMKLEVKTRTDGFVRKLWTMDATHTALFDPATLRPVTALQTEIYKKETRTTKLDFDAEGVSRLRESTPPDKKPSKTKRFKFPGVLDLYGALLFVRSQPLQKGDVVRVVVYPATDPYLAEVSVRDREKVEVGKKTYDAVKLDLKLRKITKKLELEPHSKFKRATAWLSDDRDRLLLKIQAEISVGSVWTEMESVKFNEP
jgi:hypothetical protein